MKGKLIVFSAPSGAGKTTIVRKMLENKEFKLEFSVSACSREQRANEVNGKDYFFISVDEFKNNISTNKFAEWEEVYENQFYGTLISEIDRIIEAGNNAIFDIDVVGALSIKKLYGEQALTVFVMPPSVEELENRLRNRLTDTEESIAKRVAKAEHELSFSNKFDKILINDDLEVAFSETSKLLSDFL